MFISVWAVRDWTGTKSRVMVIVVISLLEVSVLEDVVNLK